MKHEFEYHTPYFRTCKCGYEEEFFKDKGWIDVSECCYFCEKFLPHIDDKSKNKWMELFKQGKIEKNHNNCSIWLCNDEGCNFFNHD